MSQEKRKNRFCCVVIGRVKKLLTAAACVLLAECLLTGVATDGISLLGGSAQGAGWWNFGKKELQEPAPGSGAAQQQATQAASHAATQQAAKSGASQAPAANTYAAKPAENPSQSKGFTFKFPWSKKKEEAVPDPVIDPFGAAEHPHSPEYLAKNQGMSTPANEGQYAPENFQQNTLAADPMHDGPSYNPAYAENQFAADGGYDYPGQTLPTPSAVPGQSHPQVGTAAPIQPRYPEPGAYAEFTPPDAARPAMPAMQADSTTMAGEQIRVFEQGKTLAWVGSVSILAADVYHEVDMKLLPHKEKIPAPQYQQYYLQETVKALEQAIQDKLVYCDFLRSVPPDQVAKYQEMVNQIYETKELPDRMKKAEAANREDYEAKLRELGTSISRQKTYYCEGVLRQQWLMQNIQRDYEVSHAELLDYYHAHIKDFENQPRACWEELVINKSRFRSREEAYKETARLGSLVYKQQMSFGDTAREFSHGVTASDGGQNSWIHPGELASRELDNAIFTQPVGALSPSILEDAEHFYIIRVTRREEQRVTPFMEVQDLIRGKIKERKFDESLEKYLVKIQKEIPVTRADDELPTLEMLQAQQRQRAAGQNAPMGSRVGGNVGFGGTY